MVMFLSKQLKKQIAGIDFLQKNLNFIFVKFTQNKKPWIKRNFVSKSGTNDDPYFNFSNFFFVYYDQKVNYKTNTSPHTDQK